MIETHKRITVTITIHRTSILSEVLGLSHIDNIPFNLGFSFEGLNGVQIVFLYIFILETIKSQ